MRRSLSVPAFLAAALAWHGASAQNAGTAPPAPASQNLGFALGNGITFVPTVFTEDGYDSNPVQTAGTQHGSGLIRGGGGFNVTYVNPRTVASLAAAASELYYFNNAAFEQQDRFAGFVKADVTYLVVPGVTVSPGGFFNYDAQSFNKNQQAGGNIDLAYRDNFLLSALKLRYLDVEYLNSAPAGLVSPLLLTAAYNYERADATWTGLIGSTWIAAPYGEVSAGRVNYTDQPKPNLIDRSADDYHAKAGVRFNVSPQFTADIGWRANQRDTDDRRITSYSSTYFDGALTWRPSPFFALTGAVERYIGEPSTYIGILADVRSYSVKASYLPVPGVTFNLGAGWQIVSDVGSGSHYETPTADLQAIWDYNSHVQFYTTLRYQGYNLDGQNLGYSEVRVLSGVRIVPDGRDILHGESFESLYARLADAHRPIGSELSVSGGYSWFGLPGMKMVQHVGGPLWDQVTGTASNDNGNLNGWRTEVKLANFAQQPFPNGVLTSFNVSGFFANYQGSTSSHCKYTGKMDCAIVNIVDGSSTQENNTGPFGDLNVSTSRNVNYWGVTLDSRLGTWGSGGWKDSVPAGWLSFFKLGVAVRGIDETAKLIAHDPLVSVPARYKETVDAHYYGGFVGFEKAVAFGAWRLGADATAGVYYTDMDYQGRYRAYTPVIPVGYVLDSSNVSTSQVSASFIGTVRVDLKRQFGWGTAGVFGQGEYLSAVPRISYNNNDYAGGAPWGLIGTQTGTRLNSEGAFNATGGLTVSVPVN